MTTNEKMQLLFPSTYGIYIPQHFAEYTDGVAGWTGISDEDREILKEGPSIYVHDFWDAWDNVLRSATYTDDAGTWTLYQEGDLWLIHESFTDKEWSELFI